MGIEFSSGPAISAQKIAASVTLLNSADEPVASIQPSVAADAKGNFALRGELTGRDAVNVLVDIRHEGYTSFARRVPIQEAIYMQAPLTGAQAEVVGQSNVQSISGAVTNGFTLKVNDDSNDTSSMSISIPASSLPAGTQSISAAIKTYDPNNPADAQFFPGSYADSTGNGLVSVAFNYAEVKTNTGESLQTLAQNARIARQAPGAIGFAAPAEPVIINRTIPQSSCATLEKLGDANAELAGFQIPVYTYNPRSGLWDLLGYGTVYTQGGIAIPGDTRDLDCAGTTYVLEIKVTNDIFLSDWWNLDYPLQFNEPIKRCAHLHVVNEQNEPLAGVYGLIGGDGNFASTYFVTDEKGDTTLNLEVFNEQVNTASFTIWDGSGTAGNFNLSNQCPAPTQQTVILKRPQLCKIKGEARYSTNKPLANLGVYAFNESGFLSEYWLSIGSTDANGSYTLDVACNQPYTVELLFAQNMPYKGIKVDGAALGQEQMDDGKQLSLTPFIFTSIPFPTTLISIGYTPQTKEGLIMFWGMSDAFPISYNFQLKNRVTGQVAASAQGSVNIDESIYSGDLQQWFLRVGQVKIPVSLPDDLSNFAVQGYYTDGFGVRTDVDRLVIDTSAPAQ